MNSTVTIIKTTICIIGAGPAGATTSLFLSKMNIPHVIIDAAEFPRDKVCGDGLDLKVMRVLNNLEPGLVEREILNNENFIQSNSVCIHIGLFCINAPLHKSSLAFTISSKLIRHLCNKRVTSRIWQCKC